MFIKGNDTNFSTNWRLNRPACRAFGVSCLALKVDSDKTRSKAKKSVGRQQLVTSVYWMFGANKNCTEHTVVKLVSDTMR